ncbi:PAS domain S-box protein [Salipiger sp. IMCC34102]|uniref:ATP-binding protein n=1 Tax=Salipiger sp. IMCC34102 TaxID=2510647 RepID=UPI00101D8A75|nr:ATP-binding protein [Salipiger sp. IMCC34102]RYH00934.1 PAS domain S-box protein [Salipiger sp. IMCC34102]
MNFSMRQLVIPLSLIFTAVTVWITYDLTRSSADDAFEALVDDSRLQLKQRVQNISLALNGLAGFLDASENITQAEWERYVDALDLDETFPRIDGFGLIVPGEASNPTEGADGTLDASTSEFAAPSESPSTQDTISRVFAPSGRPTSFLADNTDLTASIMDAANAARDTGEIRLTDPMPVAQGQADNDMAYLLHPRYRNDLPLDTVEERRAAFLDWIYAPVIVNEVMAGMSPNQREFYTISIFDTERPDDAIFGQSDPEPGSFQIIHTNEFLGRTWEMHWNSTPAFEATRGMSMFVFVVIGGALICVLLSEYQRAIAQRDQTKSRQLVSNEDRNRAVFDNAVFGLLELDGKNFILSANAAAHHLFETEDLRGVHLRELVSSPEMSDGWTFATATTQTATGRKIHLELQRNSWTHADGAPRHTVILRDVTQATENARASRKSEERWNLALKNADIGVFDIDLRTMTSVVSDTWLRLMRIDPDTFTEDPRDVFHARLHPDDLPAILKADRDCLTGRTNRSVSEFRIKFDDGTWRYMRSDAAVAERDESGRAVRMVGAQTDIHELRTTQDALHASEERLRLAQSHAPVGMTILDGNGALTDPNAALASLTGQDLDTLSRMQLSDLFAPDDSAEIVASVIDLQGDPDRMFRKQVRIRNTEGVERWGMVKVTWASGPHGGGEIFVMQISDITQEIEAQRLKSQFVATVSHELRTPLTSIKGALGLIHKAADAPGAKFPTRLLDIAQANVDRLIYLVNDILDFEKSSSGRLEFRPSEQNAASLVQQAIEDNTPYADRFGVTLAADDTTQGAKVLADPDRLAQVLSNLMSNASKNAPEGSEVTVRIERKGARLRFGVIDRGPGVPKEFRDRIFQPFSQADSSDTRAKGGTGLGLNISRQIVEAMGGEMGFESEPGLTEFWFTCPEAAASKPRQAATAPSAPPPSDAPGPLKRVLYLEDDEAFATTLRTRLKDLATVTTARTVAQAREVIGDQSFDMILLDWALNDSESENLLDDLLDTYPDAKFMAFSVAGSAKPGAAIKVRLAKTRQTLEVVASQLHQPQGGIAAQ